MRYRLIISFLLVCVAVNAQLFDKSSKKKKPLIDISVRKSGPYFGLQQGKYTVPELGAEMIWKQIRLKKPITQAVHFGFNYNIRHEVFGTDLGCWIRPHRFGLTYGGNLVYRTDFNLHKFGIAPVIGYKFWFAHAQVGYHFLPRPNDFQTNTLFVSIRLGIINDRDIDIKIRKKRK